MMTTVHAAPVGYLPPPGASPAAVTSCHTGARAPRRRPMRLRTKVSLFFGVIALDRHRVADRRDVRLRPLLAARAAHRAGPPAGRQQRPAGPRRSCAAAPTSFGDWFQRRCAPSRAGSPPPSWPTTSRPAPTRRFSVRELPRAELRQAVDVGDVGRAALRRSAASRYVGVGVHIAEVDANYFEAFPLDPTERTLRTILLALDHRLGRSRSLLATGVGWWTSRRLLRPLGRITDAAGEIAAGDLDTRVAREGDPDLDRLADSFNDMADAVQARIEREARFASDVSHELRSPITALAAAAEVIDGRRGELPDRTQQALDVVVGQVRRFDAMVIDLLELSRIDAGATDLHTEEVDIDALCRRIAARNGFADLPIDVTSRPARTARRSRRSSTSCASSASSPTCWRTPSTTAAARCASPSSRPTGRSCSSPSRTPVRASPAASGRASSSASPAAAPPATASAPASAWPSSPSTPPPRAARRGSRTARAAAPASSCACPTGGRDEARSRRSLRRRRRCSSSSPRRAGVGGDGELQQIDSDDLFGLDETTHVDDDDHDVDDRRRRRRRRSQPTIDGRRRRRSPPSRSQLYFLDGNRLQPVADRPRRHAVAAPR